MSIRVVIDTNIYISAIFWGGKPRQVIDLGRDGKIRVYTSHDINEEIAEKLGGKFKLPENDINRIMFDFSTFTSQIPIDRKHRVVLKDPDDDKFIDCAVQCRANYIVTGDRHLLDLKEYVGVTIISVSDFLQQIFESSSDGI